MIRLLNKPEPPPLRNPIDCLEFAVKNTYEYHAAILHFEALGFEKWWLSSTYDRDYPRRVYIDDGELHTRGEAGSARLFIL